MAAMTALCEDKRGRYPCYFAAKEWVGRRHLCSAHAAQERIRNMTLYVRKKERERRKYGTGT